MDQRKQAYLSMLEEAAKVDRFYAKKNQERQDSEKYNITPVAPPQRTVEEEQNDLTLQKQRALKTASEMVSHDVAGSFVSSLSDDDVIFFNKVSGDFGKEVSRFKSVDLLFLKALWSRYAEKMAKTFGIDIPLQSGELVDVAPPVEDSGETKDSYEEFADRVRKTNSTTTDRQIRQMWRNDFQGKDRARDRAEDLLSRVGEAKAKHDEDYANLKEYLVDIPDEMSKIRFPYDNQVKRNDDDITELEKDIDIYKRHLDTLSEQRLDLDAEEATVRSRKDLAKSEQRKRLRELEERQKKVSAEIYDMRRRITDLKGRRGSFKKDSWQVIQDRDEILAPYQQRRALLKPRYDKVDLTDELAQFYPYGLEVAKTGRRDEPDQDYGDPRMGFGIHAVQRGPTLVRFGKYMIHRPALQNHELRLRFPSRVKVPKMPDRMIPVKVAHALEMALQAGRLTTPMVQGLSPSEKNLLAQIGDFADIDHPLENHDGQAELERFELLRGEIIAGNDNPSLIKELKHLVLRFMGDGRLKQLEGQRILSELAMRV